jgi:hypothetical protein
MAEYVDRPLKAKVAQLKFYRSERPAKSAAPADPAVRAVEFESRKVYQSKQRPSYTSWVSFFPGEKGQWYLTCEEVTRPEKPLPQCTRQQWYEMSLPVGYDKSQYRMEMVLLESKDNLKTWQVISREPCRFHHSAGSFGQARTRDGRFLRFVWSCYSLDPAIKPNEIFYESADNGKTWKKMPPFHDPHFASYPHRLRTLRDGTLVLAVPLAPKWGQGTDHPVRAAMRLDTSNEMPMTLFFSHDQGKTWTGPLPIFAGQTVSETDFVELPSGDLLCINNSIFANPGRQIVYRAGNRFTPGPLERVRAGRVPETVCLTKDGILVGCMRPGAYSWSDDLGQTWQPLDGIPQLGPEVYQPWMNLLDDGRIACAGHLGADDAIGSRDQYLSIHFFRLNVARKTKDTQLLVERDFDDAKNKWRNRYTITLTCAGAALPDKELEFWYVERGKPGYDSFNKLPLEERRKLGGQLVKVRTGPDGKAQVSLPHLDAVTDVHYSYQLVVRFNADRADRDYKPAQTPQLEMYANNYQDPPLRDVGRR